MRPFLSDIILHTAEVFQLTVDDIKGRSRVQYIVRARHAACYLAGEMTVMSLPQIGDRMGGRDHSTILHACRAVPEIMKRDRHYADSIDLIRERVSNATEVLRTVPGLTLDQEIAIAIEKCAALDARREAQRAVRLARDEAERVQRENELRYAEIEARRVERERLIMSMTDDELTSYLAAEYAKKPLSERLAA